MVINCANDVFAPSVLDSVDFIIFFRLHWFKILPYHPYKPKIFVPDKGASKPRNEKWFLLISGNHKMKRQALSNFSRCTFIYFKVARECNNGKSFKPACKCAHAHEYTYISLIFGTDNSF